MMFFTCFRRPQRWLFVMLCLLTTLQVSADPITRQQALQQASRFLEGRTGSRLLTPVDNGRKLAPRNKNAATGHDLYYVFNRGAGEGYIIISGDDLAEPVICYSESGEFDYTQIAPAMRYMLDGHAREVEFISAHAEEIKATPRRALKTHPAVGILCTSRWNQGSPYNDDCPNFFGQGRSVTGCVATAMAQLLYYQRAKSVTETQAEMPSYQNPTDYNGQKMIVEGIPEHSPIDWDNMLDTYGSSATGKQKKAVAQLMHYCGVAVEMGYSNTASGAYSSNVPTAFQKYFGYGSSTRYLWRNDYSEEKWDEIIYNEIANSRPVYLSGANSEGGHAFVCDGYDGNKCYHINWGWGGSSDNYFLLSSLNPSSQGIGGTGDGYNQQQEAVIGIEPENYLSRSLPISNSTLRSLCTKAFDADGDGVLTYGEAAAVTDLGTTFKETRISTFNELYYFSGLTSIGDDAFSGCAMLTTVKLPKHLKHIGARAFKGCAKLKTMVLSDSLTSIGEEAFEGCKVFALTSLPDGIMQIPARTFQNCEALTTMTLPLNVAFIGDEAFAGCTKLKSVTVRNFLPENIKLGNNVFDGVSLEAATLNVRQGTSSYFQAASQWNAFGNIYQQRDLSYGRFLNEPLVLKDLYVYNVGTGRYLTKGEAYGTQAVVAETDEPMRFQLRRSAAMADGVYYLYSNDTGNENAHILFRTNTDKTVGQGINACFVDGADSKRTDSSHPAYWKVASVSEGIFTLQIPSNVKGYVASQYLGVLPSHASDYSFPTYGIYSDVVYEEYPLNCQWRFVEYNEADVKRFQSAQVLERLLAKADTRHIGAANEQAVYDNLDSSEEELRAAQRSLRSKLGLMDFADENVRKICVDHFDVDGDGELSASEIDAVPSLEYEFNTNKNIVSFDELQQFSHLTMLYGNSFQNCSNLQSIKFPEGLARIYYSAFSGCRKLSSIELPECLVYIGQRAFASCVALNEVTVLNPDPSSISLGTNVFAGVNLADATLYVPFGSKELFAEADQWKAFGTIKEIRARTMPPFSPFVANAPGYLFNLGTRRFLGNGEAYGTQAVVNETGLLYQFRRTSRMAEGVYYLYSEETGQSNKILFRTDEDSKVGAGVKTCFVDGTSSTKAYWRVDSVGVGIYTLQVPESDASFVDGEYLGVQLDHESKAAYPTFGLYWDVVADDNPRSCQWAFILAEDVNAARTMDSKALELKQLLTMAAERQMEAVEEQAVYDDPASTLSQLSDAIASLRRKYHFITFADERAKALCLNEWDGNGDGELSLEEAAAVTDLGTRFKSASSVKSFEELRFFTGLTKIDDDAFRSCSGMTSVYVPAHVTAIGSNVFTGCSALKYVAIPGGKPEMGTTLARTITLFVPQGQLEAYAADEQFNRATIVPYTGVPTVQAEDAARAYGRTNSRFSYTVSGAPINGEPTLSCDAVATTPVGDYPIVIEAGTITSEGLRLVNGTMTVEPAEVTVKVQNCERPRGVANPDFTATYSGWKNREKAEEVMLTWPTFECDATPDSPAGTYEIRAYGAEAQNYQFIYEAGTLTVTNADGIDNLAADGKQHTTYDLSGRKVTTPQRGVYIVDGKKIVK